jgi:ligand-binding sensor domain-containing protein
MLAAVDGIGVFRSTSQGTGWTSVNSGLPNKLAKCIVYDSKGKAYAGLNGSGIYTTTDDGNSWNESDTGMTNKSVLNVYIGNNGNIYAGTWFLGTIFMSADNGATWSDIGPAGNDIHSIFVAGNGDLYAGTDHNGLYKSTNGGKKWSVVGISGVIVYSIISDKSGNLYAGATDGAYISTDNGNNWNKTTLNANLVRSLIVSKTGYLFAATSSGIFRSIDNGASWKDFSAGLNELDLNTYCFALSSDDILYTGTLRNVYKANLPDGVNETLANNFELKIYPQPAKEKVNFAMTLNSANYTTLLIYDVLGNCAGRLCNSFLGQGNYHFEFNPTGLPSGIYYYKLQCGTEIKSGEIVYMP